MPTIAFVGGTRTRNRASRVAVAITPGHTATVTHERPPPAMGERLSMPPTGRYRASPRVNQGGVRSCREQYAGFCRRDRVRRSQGLVGHLVRPEVFDDFRPQCQLERMSTRMALHAVVDLASHGSRTSGSRANVDRNTSRSGRNSPNGVSGGGPSRYGRGQPPTPPPAPNPPP